MDERSVQHATFVIERRFKASPARVFHAWADPAARARWESPGEDWTMEDLPRDFRVGGEEVARFGPKGGPMFEARTRYHEIRPERRILFSYEMHGLAEGGGLGSVSLASVELLQSGSGTRLIFTEQGTFLDGSDTPEMRQEGWDAMLSKLVAVVDEAG
ncbi:SRPBCC family protein [Geminicoccus roseus]|uniref:SRPBCC family protein n=1 Tax=Geminicoccus roseus TaxID=404900 RepID=UPI0004820062|nr:SRPBCC family protein [Geminicoccus roseus]